MEQLIVNMIAGLRKQVLEKVPDEGEFEMVHETIENPNPNWHLSHIRLKVSNIPEKIKECGGKRFLDVVVFNQPYNPYMCERAVGFGNKQDILRCLDEPELVQKILDVIPQLESDLNDE